MTSEDMINSVNNRTEVFDARFTHRAWLMQDVLREKGMRGFYREGTGLHTEHGFGGTVEYYDSDFFTHVVNRKGRVIVYPKKENRYREEYNKYLLKDKEKNVNSI